MKSHTPQYKEKIYQLGREIDSKITFTTNGEVVELGGEDLNSITPINQTSLLKSIMKQLDIESNVDIPVGMELNYKFGIKLDNGDYEYIDFGNYIVYSNEKQEDTKTYKLVCYDKMLLSMVEYEDLEIEYPITIREYLNILSNHLGLEFKNRNDTFVNYDKTIENELYLNENKQSMDYTYRDVFDEISQVIAGNIQISNDDKLEIKYPIETNDTIDEYYLKDINVKFGEKYGPINSVVLSRADNSDSIYTQDIESIELNGLTEFRISENQIMNFNNREEFLQGIFSKLNGLEFYMNDYSSTGITYYDLLDFYNVSITDEEENTTTYKCLMLNDEINITQGLEESIHTDKPEETKTDYSKSDTTDKRINQTYVIANKQKGEIEALTSEVYNMRDDLGDVYTMEQVNQLIQNAQDGLVNKFVKKGGTNLIKNSSLIFEETKEIQLGDELVSVNGYEYWDGNLQRIREEDSVTGYAIGIGNGESKQIVDVIGGTYTLSFKYKRLSRFADFYISINDEEEQFIFENGNTSGDIIVDGDLDDNEDNTENIEENEIETYAEEEEEENNEEEAQEEKRSEEGEYIKTFTITNKTIEIKFRSNMNDGFEIYDLMLNVGGESSPYSQHQNEVTAESVKIGKGIQVESSSTHTVTRVDSDGFRVLSKDNQDEVLLKATDVGTQTKELVVQNKATINKLLIQEIEDQVWLSGL